MTMITVKLFGPLTSLMDRQTGPGHLTVPLPPGGRVCDLVHALEHELPKVAELVHKKKVLIAVNQEIAHPEQRIREGDEVALLPPFSGGADLAAECDELFARLQQEDFSVEAELARVRARSLRIGGLALFLGTARDRSQGREVCRLTFEHYDGMAQRTLREIRAQALRDFDVIEVLIVHRYGEINVGDNIVLVIAAAEHRADAFRACRWSIDELKRTAPIWKREQTPEGALWVEEHP